LSKRLVRRRLKPLLLEAVAFDMMRDQLLDELLDNLFLLRFHIVPEPLETFMSFRDVLIVTPDSVEAPAQFVNQFVNQIVIVIFATTRLSDVLIFFVGDGGHRAVLSDCEPSGSWGLN
jgi:hypothetical protein